MYSSVSGHIYLCFYFMYFYRMCMYYFYSWNENPGKQTTLLGTDMKTRKNAHLFWFFPKLIVLS